jgi:hypothetical protein
MSKVKIICSLGIFLISMTASVYSTFAADFIVKVGADIKNLDDRVTHLEVKCNVGMGKGEAKVPVRNGRFRGVIDVPVSDSTVINPKDKVAYLCGYAFITKIGIVHNANEAHAKCKNQTTLDALIGCAKPGSKYVSIIRVD